MRAKDGTRKIEFKLTQGDAAGEGRCAGWGGGGVGWGWGGGRVAESVFILKGMP